MTKTWTGLATRATQSDSWFRTMSPEVAIHIGETSFYSHRLRLLGHSNSFGLTGCLTCVGPITVGDITYETDVALDFGEPRASYTVHVPIEGWLESRHRGQQLTSTPTLASLYRPDGDIAVTRWPGVSRHLTVKIDQAAVDRALQALVNGPADSPIAFNPTMPLNAAAGDGQDADRRRRSTHFAPAGRRLRDAVRGVSGLRCRQALVVGAAKHAAVGGGQLCQRFADERPVRLDAHHEPIAGAACFSH